MGCLIASEKRHDNGAPWLWVWTVGHVVDLRRTSKKNLHGEERSKTPKRFRCCRSGDSTFNLQPASAAPHPYSCPSPRESSQGAQKRVSLSAHSHLTVRAQCSTDQHTTHNTHTKAVAPSVPLLHTQKTKIGPFSLFGFRPSRLDHRPTTELQLRQERAGNNLP